MNADPKKDDNCLVPIEVFEECAAFIEQWDPGIQEDDYADFADRWMFERRRKKKPVNVNALAVAMHKAGFADTWQETFMLAGLVIREIAQP